MISVQYFTPVTDTDQIFYRISPAAFDGLKDSFTFIHGRLGSSIGCHHPFDGEIVEIFFAIVSPVGIIFQSG